MPSSFDHQQLEQITGIVAGELAMLGDTLVQKNGTRTTEKEQTLYEFGAWLKARYEGKAIKVSDVQTAGSQR